MSSPPPRAPRSLWLSGLLACFVLVLLGLAGWWWSNGSDASGFGARFVRRSAATGSTLEGKAGDAPAGAGAVSSATQADGGSLWLGGLVTDEQGQPLEAVNVLLRANALSSLDRPVSATTDAEGRYQLGPLPPGLYDVSFRKPHYLSHRVSAHAVATSGSLDAVLTPALLVEGQVVNEVGQPVPRSRLRLISQEPNEDGDDDEDFGTVAEENSDESGLFVLDAPGPGPWRLIASHRDYLYRELEVTAPARELKVVLPTSAAVEVQVVDEQDRPVAGAECLLVVDEGRLGFGPRDIPTRTDERGRAVLGGVRGGRYRVSASSPPGEPFRMAWQRVELRERERRLVRLRFEEGQRLEGVVVDGKGLPVAGAAVLAVPDEVLGSWRAQVRSESPLVRWYSQRLRNEWQGKEGRPVLSGQDGRFVLRHLLAQPYRLSAVKPGYVLDAAAMGGQLAGEGHEQGVRVAVGSRAPVRLVLAYRGLLRGRVIRQGGEPLTTFTLNNLSLRSEDGTFAVPVANTGPLELTFGAPGLASTVRRAVMEPGRDVELGDVVLQEGRPVRVRVVDAEGGGPVARAGVRLWREEEGRRFFMGVEEATGRDGSLLLPSVESRPLVLEVQHEEYLAAYVPLEPGQREVTVTLRAGALLQGQVHAASQPVRYGKVVLYTPGGDLVHAIDVRDGWYSRRGIEPGRYVARAESPSYPEATVYLPRDVEVPESGVVELNFESESRGGVLDVQVPEEDADEEKDVVRLVPGRWPRPGSVAALRVLLLRSHPYDHEYGHPDTFTFRWLAPGPYTLLAWRERRGRLLLHAEEVELSAGAQRSLRLSPRWQDVGDTGERGRLMWGVP
ncbi:carboxypeptidase-like regulatory domain-containing protein [Vitiosangium sp. GDMCC 1.1324]|uniref:carboxypeptidase-like regulatory domain-containing protein n=1 Tax=Vitiosangium sp. (strain GDMCC 1.1324) TaxID=2138576 RepID=UPI000D380FDF|nr:carboxypeptidase-like regulatory domain-containing protein [Vitiosangium sp. GDMCC 1.1324]PTL77451.1 hypothetical protein DAT35_44415 [Vitiosangium sp. GDMCC 1.1324]